MNNQLLEKFLEFFERGGEHIRKYPNGAFRCSWHTPIYGTQYTTGDTILDALNQALVAMNLKGGKDAQ